MMCSSVKFIVILLIVRIGVILTCCVKPVRLHKCTAGPACANNPYHCKECHKDTWVQLANADEKPKDMNEVEDRSDEYVQATTELDDFIDNEIPKRAIDTGSSSEDIHVPKKRGSNMNSRSSSENVHAPRNTEPKIDSDSSAEDIQVPKKPEDIEVPRKELKAHVARRHFWDSRSPLMYLNASFIRSTEADNFDAGIIIESPEDEREFKEEKSVREQISEMEDQMNPRSGEVLRFSQPITTTTAKPEEKKLERGFLDLLFPSTRVRAFKKYFDAFKNFLSQTF